MHYIKVIFQTVTHDQKLGDLLQSFLELLGSHFMLKTTNIKVYMAIY